MVIKNKKTILVTGGSGYIGSHVVRYFLDNNFNVINIDRLIFKHDSSIDLNNNTSYKFYNLDIRNIDEIKNKIKEVDHVVHLAALVGEKACKRDEKETMSVNYEATIKLAKFSLDLGAKSFIFMSTASSYGVQDINQVADENTKLNPVSSYAVSKINSEKDLLDSFSGKMKIFIFRPSTVHGICWRMRFDLIVNHLMKDAYLNNEITVLGPKMWRPLMWVGEPSRIFLNLIRNDEFYKNSEIFNLGVNSENFQKIQIAEIMQKEIFPNLKINIIDKDPDLRSYKVDFSKIEKVLNHKANLTIEDAMKGIFDSLKNKTYEPLSNEYYYN